MGLDVEVKGMTREETYHGGYVRFNIYRKEIASAYDEQLGELYSKTFYSHLTAEEIEEWDNICNDDLDLFLWHSDCDGKFTPQECKKIYNAIKDLKIDMKKGEFYNMHKLWLNMFKHCYKKRVNMYFY